jgi:hypothetical protein
MLQQYTAGQKSAVLLPVAQTTFYNFASGEQAKFEAMPYYVPGTTNGIKGAEILKGEALKTADIAQYIEANPDMGQVRLLLKASKALGANPAKLLITNLSLNTKQFSPLIYISSPQLDGELLYYGLRGNSEEKGQGSSLMLQRLIKARRDKVDDYKQQMEASFYRCSRAAKDAYSDTNKYPLRRWLYEEYKDQDALMWMNMLTKSDPQND